MSANIKGIAKYQNLEGGFWSIITDDGQKLRPIEMPVQLQQESAQVDCTVEFLEDDFGFQMWGETVKIVGFTTIS